MVGGRVGGRVVDDDQLEVHRLLPEDRVDCLGEVQAAIAGRDHDRNLRRPRRSLRQPAGVAHTILYTTFRSLGAKIGSPGWVGTSPPGACGVTLSAAPRAD